MMERSIVWSTFASPMNQKYGPRPDIQCAQANIEIRYRATTSTDSPSQREKERIEKHLETAAHATVQRLRSSGSQIDISVCPQKSQPTSPPPRVWNCPATAGRRTSRSRLEDVPCNLEALAIHSHGGPRGPSVRSNRSPSWREGRCVSSLFPPVPDGPGWGVPSFTCRGGRVPCRQHVSMARCAQHDDDGHPLRAWRADWLWWDSIGRFLSYFLHLELIMLSAHRVAPRESQREEGGGEDITGCAAATCCGCASRSRRGRTQTLRLDGPRHPRETRLLKRDVV